MIVVKGRALLTALFFLIIAGVGIRIAVKPFDLEQSVRNAGLTIEDSYYKHLERYRAVITKSRHDRQNGELSASAVTDSPKSTVPEAKKLPDISIKSSKSSSKPKPDSSFINAALEYKLQASRTRSERVENLRSVLAASGLSADEKSKAEESLLLLGDAKAKETDTETLLQAKGYGTVVASLDEGGLRVFIDRVLDIDDVATIGQAIANRTGLPLEKIIIAQRQDS